MSGPTAISLFSGLGGIDIGLHRAGVETLVTVDSDETAAKSLRANSSEYESGLTGTGAMYEWSVIEEDIHDISAGELLKQAGTDDIDFMVGGPPCQTFSRSNEGNRQGTDAERGMLFQEYARLLEEIKPKAFVFENVRGLASANDGEDFEIIKQQFSDAGYTINDSVLNAANYGVPQTRKRLFVIGFLNSRKPYFPEPSHVEAKNPITGKSSWVTAAEALHDLNVDAELTSDEGYANAVGGKYGYLLKDVPPGGNYQHFSERKYVPEKGEYVERSEDELDAKVFDWRSRHYNYLLKQDPNRPTWTLQASPGTYVGPFHWRSRRYSFLEQMRLMDIPIEYEICGPPREIQRQIGNAVPPGVIEAIVRSLLDQLNISPGDSKDSRMVEPVRADGSGVSPDTDGHFEVTPDNSPWRYVESIVPKLAAGETVSLAGRGKYVSNTVDILELLRLRTNTTPEFSLSEEVEDNPDGSKSDRLSVLKAEISP
jgi:DNA (cytosine-5)-methyltransferase 1